MALPILEKLPGAAPQPLLSFRCPGEQWLELDPRDTSLNRKEAKGEFSSTSQWVTVNLLEFINRQSFHLLQSTAVFLSHEWNSSRPRFSNCSPTLSYLSTGGKSEAASAWSCGTERPFFRSPIEAGQEVLWEECQVSFPARALE